MPLLTGQPINGLQVRRATRALNVLARRGRIADVETAVLRHDPTLQSADRDIVCTVDVRTLTAQALIEIGMHVPAAGLPRPGTRFFGAEGLIATRPLIRCRVGLGWEPITVTAADGPVAELWEALREDVAEHLQQTGHATDSVLACALRRHGDAAPYEPGRLRHLHAVPEPGADVINLAAHRRRRRAFDRAPA